MNGNCRDDFGDCILPSNPDGFETCTDYCASIGEECVQQGCGTSTYRAWIDAGDCEQFAAAVGYNDDPCDTPIDFGSSYIRCCCTDRAP
jgi:hypothetical protein